MCPPSSRHAARPISRARSSGPEASRRTVPSPENSRISLGRRESGMSASASRNTAPSSASSPSTWSQRVLTSASRESPLIARSLPQRATRAVERRAYARDLLGGEHEHRGVVGIVHVVHEHVAVRPVVAADFGKRRRSVIWARRIWRGGDRVTAAAVWRIAPDVPQVQVVANFMRGRTAFVEGSPCRPVRPERLKVNDDAVGGGWTTGKLRVAEQSIGQRTDPHVQELLGIDGG